MSSTMTDRAARRVGHARPGWERGFRWRLVAGDAAGIVLALTIAYAARFGGDLERPILGTSFSYLALSATILVVWLAALSWLRTRSRRVLGAGVSEYLRVANASLVAFGALAILFLATGTMIARGFFFLVLAIGVTLVLAGRRFWRGWLRSKRRHHEYVSRALLVGEPTATLALSEEIGTDRAAEFVVAAALDSDEPDEIRSTAAEVRADTVLVAGSGVAGDGFVRRLGWALEDTGIDLVLASPISDIAEPRLHLRNSRGLPFLIVTPPRFSGGAMVAKRLLDLAVSALALVLLSPLLLAVAIAVRIDSPGPAIFSQERVGLRGATFTIRKFRSMTLGAESALSSLEERNEGAGPLFKLRDDPRVTRVGRLLRRTSLDELPQLWNVLRGDMSLVGPRPPLPVEVAAYGDTTRRRLLLPPGITGLWQIGGRSDLSWEESIRLDLYYVENWSPLGDLVVIWRTVAVVLRPQGAY